MHMDSDKQKFIAHKRKLDDLCQSLEAHLVETGTLARSFASKIGLADLGELLGLLHDFGKYSETFQTYIKSATGELDQDDESYVDAKLLKGKIDHSTAGAQLVYRRLRARAENGLGELLGQIMAVCIASHHSGLIDVFSVDVQRGNVFKRRICKEENRAHLEECQINASPLIMSRADGLMNDNTLAIFTDYLGEKFPEDNDLYSKVGAFKLGMLTRFLFSCLIDADRLNSAEFELPARLEERLKKQAYFNWSVAIDRLEEFVTTKLQPSKPIDFLRQDISKTCFNRAGQAKGIHTLTVPTGGGKTYASLRYAVHHAMKNKLERIFYVIPYTSIIEQNAKVMREVLEREEDEFSWILEHHSNLEPNQQTWHSKLIAENWDAPIVITTMVQFLETLFSGGTRGVRRMHQFANSLIVFDEIQTLPIKCVHLFCNAMNFLVEQAGVSALLCTATQPVLDKLSAPEKGELKLAENHELMADLDLAELFERLRRVHVEDCSKAGGWSEEEIVELALQQFNKTGSCLVIVNTKKWAQKIYQRCEGQVSREALFHLSTNQCAAHRRIKLEEIKARLASKAQRPVLCISTQLIEAGVDIDFASVIRFMTGLDSIAQAAGRCNRNGLLNAATVFVVNPHKESTQMLEEIEAGKEASQRIFRESFDDVLAPSAIEQYFNYYFFSQHRGMDYKIKDSVGKNTNLLHLLSTNDSPKGLNRRRQNAKYLPILQQAFMEAGKAFDVIDAPTQALIVPYGRGSEIIQQLCGEQFDPATYYSLLKEAQKYSVNVYPNLWKKLLGLEAIHEIQPGEGVYYVLPEHYSDDFGLSEEILEGGMCFLGA